MKFVITQFKSCDHTLREASVSFYFFIHGESFRGTKHVTEVKRYYMKKLITELEFDVNKTEPFRSTVETCIKEPRFFLGSLHRFLIK